MLGESSHSCQQVPSRLNQEEIDETDNDSSEENETDSEIEPIENEKPKMDVVKQPVINFQTLRKNTFVVIALVYNKNSKKECCKEFLGKIVDIKENKFFISCLRSYKEKKHVCISQCGRYL